MRALLRATLVLVIFSTAATAAPVEKWGYDIEPPAPIKESFYYESIYGRPMRSVPVYRPHAKRQPLTPLTPPTPLTSYEREIRIDAR